MFCDVRCLSASEQVLYGETPCNPDISILDLEEFGKLGKTLSGVVTIIDSTFGTPYLQKPINYGIDVVVHSALVTDLVHFIRSPD